eukprot:scaffold1816_cov134-Isochrysis_galbana.AAC.7
MEPGTTPNKTGGGHRICDGSNVGREGMHRVDAGHARRSANPMHLHLHCPRLLVYAKVVAGLVHRAQLVKDGLTSR